MYIYIYVIILKATKYFNDFNNDWAYVQDIYNSTTLCKQCVTQNTAVTPFSYIIHKYINIGENKVCLQIHFTSVP